MNTSRISKSVGKGQSGKNNIRPPSRPFTESLPSGFDFGSSPHYHHHHNHHTIWPSSSANTMPLNTINPYGPIAWPLPLPPQNPILQQIDYYFSVDNLIKDSFLRAKMDDQGFVPISLISNFPRVKNLTDNISDILNSLRCSKIVEIQGEKIRRRDGWKRWILNPNQKEWILNQGTTP